MIMDQDYEHNNDRVSMPAGQPHTGGEDNCTTIANASQHQTDLQSGEDAVDIMMSELSRLPAIETLDGETHTADESLCGGDYIMVESNTDHYAENSSDAYEMEIDNPPSLLPEPPVALISNDLIEDQFQQLARPADSRGPSSMVDTDFLKKMLRERQCRYRDDSPQASEKRHEAQIENMHNETEAEVYEKIEGKAEKNAEEVEEEEEAKVEAELEKELDEEFQRYSAIMRAYDRKIADGTLTDDDEIAFRRAKNAHMDFILKTKDDRARKLISMGEEWNAEPTLFVPDHPFARSNGSGLNNAAFQMNGPMSHAMMQGFEDLDNDADEAEEEQGDCAPTPRKHGNGKSSQTGKQTSSKKKMNKPNKSKSAKPTRGEIKKQRAEKNLFNPANLLRPNIFRDVAENTSRAKQPTFTSTRKKDALNELVASIPSALQPIAKVDKAQLDEATKHFTPRASCKADGQGGWKVNGMKSSLDHFQMLAVSSMRKRELGCEFPKGGIHADEMGLGKTVMMIANIVNGRSPKVKQQPTLIVAPNSLLLQWMDELERHAEEDVLPGILRYQGQSKIHSNNPVAALSKYEIVLTTYDAVRISYPKYCPPAECVTAEQKAAWWKEYYEKHRGIFHRITFHRVILDEAHAIKNPRSATSIACRALKADYRWAMSGTPVQNNIIEFYSYFRFLQVPQTGSLRVFTQNYYTEDGRGAERLNLILRNFMIRRTHNDELFGAKLIDLPKPTKWDCKCYFSTVEREIYNVVRGRIIQRINGFLRVGESRKQYKHLFAMYTLLRQLVSHPLLAQEACRHVLEPEDFDKLDKILQSETKFHSPQDELLRNLRMLYATGYNHSSALPDTLEPESSQGPERRSSIQVVNEGGAIKESSSKITQDLSEVSAGGSYGVKSNFQEYVKDLRLTAKFDKVQEISVCPQCQEIPTEPYTIACRHSYCSECLMNLLSVAREQGKNAAHCTQCGAKVLAVEEYDVFNRIEASDPFSSASADTQTTEGRPSQSKKLRDAQSEINKWIDKNGHTLPSAKTLAIKAQVLNWFQEEPGVKMIIYSQFLVSLRILARICEIEGWNYISYTGMMKVEARAAAVKKFEQDKGPIIFLCSLKAGGLGLNLTMAWRVIIADLWWNTAVEQQAFCRTYRRGQTRETTLVRFIVQDTVETLMVEMQERKEKNIAAVMDNETKANKRLSTAELLSLFGPIGRDEQGNQFIIVQEPKHPQPQRVPAQVDEEDLEMDDEV